MQGFIDLFLMFSLVSLVNFQVVLSGCDSKFFPPPSQTLTPIFICITLSFVEGV